MTLKRGLLRSLLGVALLTLIYCAYSYSGPYRWLAELSLSMFGSYEPPFVFFGAFVMLFVPPALLIARFDPERASAADNVRAAAVQSARMARIQGWLTLAAAGGVLLLVGGRDLWAGLKGGNLIRASCASIEAGNAPAGTWLEISGTALPDAAIKTREGYVDHVYVPLVSETWSKATPLAVVIRFGGDHPPDLRAPSFKGGVSTESLPGMVRTAYEAEGVQAGSAFVLDVGQVPAEHLTRGGIMSLAGVVALLVGSVMIWRKWS